MPLSFAGSVTHGARRLIVNIVQSQQQDASARESEEPLYCPAMACQTFVRSGFIGEGHDDFCTDACRCFEADPRIPRPSTTTSTVSGRVPVKLVSLEMVDEGGNCLGMERFGAALIDTRTYADSVYIWCGPGRVETLEFDLLGAYETFEAFVGVTSDSPLRWASSVLDEDDRSVGPRGRFARGRASSRSTPLGDLAAVDQKLPDPDH